MTQVCSKGTIKSVYKYDNEQGEKLKKLIQKIMYYLVCLLMTPGIKMCYYIAVQLIDNSENKKIKGILAVLASYIIELGQFGLRVDFNSYKLSLIIEMLLVYLAVLVILWIRKSNRNLINISVFVPLAIMYPMCIYAVPEGTNTALMLTSWFVGSAFCNLYMYIAFDIPDMKNQKKALRKIEDNRVLRDSQTDVMQIYQGFGQKSIESIDEIKAAIIKNISAEQLDENIKNTVTDMRVKEYCSNTIVNQIIYLMKNRCTDIEFDADVDVNSIIEIDELSLSSVMLNLLDNAYNYCEADKKSSKKYIKLTMNMRGDYLTINVVNSYSGKVKAKKADKSSVLREHGWGRIIIKDIAKKYGGQFNTVISKNMYTAKVILCSDKRGEIEPV